MSVGEANKKEGLSRPLLWAWAAFLPLGFLALAFGIAYAVYRADTVQIDGSPWRLLAAVAWLPYTMLAHVVVCSMSLSLPLAPAAAREALIRAATAGTGLLMIPGCGQSSSTVALRRSLPSAARSPLHSPGSSPFNLGLA